MPMAYTKKTGISLHIIKDLKPNIFLKQSLFGYIIDSNGSEYELITNCIRNDSH